MDKYKNVKAALLMCDFSNPPAVEIPGSKRDDCSYFHIVNAGVLQSVGDEYKAMLPNGEIVTTPNANREKSVFLEFESEFGETLVVLYLFHKGNTFRVAKHFVDKAKVAALEAAYANVEPGPDMFAFDIQK